MSSCLEKEEICLFLFEKVFFDCLTEEKGFLCVILMDVEVIQFVELEKESNQSCVIKKIFVLLIDN
jgi:hypothetical protein